MIRSVLALLTLAASPLAPALASPALGPGESVLPADSRAALDATGGTSDLPAQLRPAEQVQFRAVFAAIRARAWADAAMRLEAMPDNLLAPLAWAELMLANGSPYLSDARIMQVLAQAPELPQARTLLARARARGLSALPELPALQDLVSLPGAPKRSNARTTRSDAVAARIGPQILRLLKEDRPSDAEPLLAARQEALTGEALTEWQQRIAWSYYLTGDDANARRMADLARQGSGEWRVQADWVAGLAAWRQQDYASAASAFDMVALRGSDYEMRAAGLFWAARADTAAGRPERVAARLRGAARLPETFYGMLATASLGIELPAPVSQASPLARDWRELSRLPNIRVAAALKEIDEDGLADSILRHQARIGLPRDHAALLQLTAGLGLPATQIWLAQHGPAGASMPASARYPVPAWNPRNGWRVDPSLVFAHALQESRFRTNAVSRSGAIGLMQIMPNTATEIARKKGEKIDAAALTRPAIAFEYGQSYLEMLRDMNATQGLLPKIIAAYNAGPGSVHAWNAKLRDNGDPLLFIESIPFQETRGYVAIVLRNYWMYQLEKGETLASMKAMAQGLWPRFPGLPGKTALKLDPGGVVASAD